MNYEKAYKEALERAKYCLTTDMDNSGHWAVNHIFPQLKESKEEKIRKAILEHIQLCTESIPDRDKFIAWLEKQGEKKPIINVPPREVILSIWDLGNEWKELTNGSISTEYGTQLDYIQKHWHESECYLKEKQGEQTPADSYCQENCKGFQETGKCFADGDCKAKREAESIDKVVTKFKVGDWIVSDYNNVAYIESIGETKYNLQCKDGYHEKMSIEYIDRCWHLWSIEDAKDGDVLVHNGCTFIFKGIKDGIVQAIEENILEPVSFGKPDEDNDYHPATKEQRDLLFAKMKDAGYEWNEEKKVLPRIEKQTPKSKWTEEDEKNWRGIMYVIEENKDFAPDYDIETYDAFISWLNNIKQRMEEVK